MREIDREEKVKRGCEYCKDITKKKKKKFYGKAATPHLVIGEYCPYDECPYKELNNHDTYGEYLKNTEPFQFIMPRGEENL